MNRGLPILLLVVLALAWWLVGREDREQMASTPMGSPQAGAMALASEVAPVEVSQERSLVEDGEDAATRQEAPLGSGVSSATSGVATRSESPSDPIEELFELWYWITDKAGTPIENAVISVSSGGKSSTGKPREEDGAIRVGEVPRGTAQVEIRAPGFATVRTPTLVPWSPPRMEWIELRPAATVVGELVLEDGEPFDGDALVTFWGERLQSEAVSTLVHGPSFRLEDVTAGRMYLTAGVPAVGNGAVVSAVAEAGTETPLVLTVPRGDWTLEGRVVSALDSRPLEATVSLAPPQGIAEEVVSAALPLAATSGDGRFDLAAGLIEGAKLVVRSPGYSRRELDLDLTEATGPRIDVGEIALEAARPLTFRLTSNRAIAFEDVRLSTDDATIPLSAFDEEGYVVLADYPGDGVRAWIDLPDGSRVQVFGHVPPERIYDVPLDGLSSVVVDFRLDDVPEGSLALTVQHRATDWYELRRVVRMEDLAPVRIEGIPGTPVTCKLQVLSGPVIASASGTFVDGESELHLTLGKGRSKRFRIVDGDGLPRPGAVLYVAQADGKAVGATLRADDDGNCSSTTLPDGELLANVKGSGLRTGIPIEDGPDLQVIEVDASAALEITVELDGLPLADAAVSLTDPRLQRVVVAARHTDAQGHLAWEGIHPGAFLVQIRHPEIAKIDEEVLVEEGGTLRTFQAHRP